MRVLVGRILVAVSVEAAVETKLPPSNHGGAVSPETNDEEAKAPDENPEYKV